MRMFSSRAQPGGGAGPPDRGQHGSDAYVRRIHLNDELSGGVGENEGAMVKRVRENYWRPGERAESGG